MLINKLVLSNNTKNIDALQNRVDYKVYQIIGCYENYEAKQFQVLYRELIQLEPRYFSKVLNKLDENISFYWEAMKYCFKNPGNTEEIISKWTKLENQSLFSRPYLEIGTHYENLKNYDRACQYYEKCLERFQENDRAYFHKGKLLLQSEKEDEGLNLLKLGSRINNQNINIMQALGLYYEKHQNLGIANKYYESIQDIQMSEVIAKKIKENEAKMQKKRQLEEASRKKEVKKPVKQIHSVLNNNQSAFSSKKQIELKNQKPVVKINKQIEEQKPQKLEIAPKIEQEKKSLKKSNEQPKVVAKRPINDKQLSQIEKGLNESFKDEIHKNPRDGSRQWKEINLLKQKGLEDEAIFYLESLIRNSRKQHDIVLQICWEIQEMYLIFTNKDKVIKLLSLLKQTHKFSVVGHLYHTYLSILQNDRQQSQNAIASCKLVVFMDEWLQKQTKWSQLFQSYIYLFALLINNTLVELLSLDQSFKRMIAFLSQLFAKENINIKKVIKQELFLKNLLVQCSQSQPNTLLYVPDLNDTIITEYLSKILVKQDMAYIVTRADQLKRKLQTFLRIIVFPETIQQLGRQIDGLRKNFQIFVIKTKNDPTIIQDSRNKCQIIKDENGRVRYQTSKTIEQIISYLIQQTQNRKIEQ